LHFKMYNNPKCIISINLMAIVRFGSPPPLLYCVHTSEPNHVYSLSSWIDWKIYFPMYSYIYIYLTTIFLKFKITYLQSKYTYCYITASTFRILQVNYTTSSLFFFVLNPYYLSLYSVFVHFNFYHKILY